MKNYQKRIQAQFIIFVTDFSSNNKLHQHLVNYVKIIQSKQSVSDMNNS